MSALVFLLLAGCGDGGFSIEGTLGPDVDVRQVWVQDGPGPVAVEQGAFRLDGVEGDTVQLIFGGGDREEHRMRIIGASAAGRIVLLGVWLDDGLAFPNRVEVDGGVIEVNRLRFGELAGGDEAREFRGEVLAVDGEGELALLRPSEDGLPDVRLMILDGTAVRSVDGDEADASGLGAGDTVQVRGVVDAGYLMASELILPRRVARAEPPPEPSAPREPVSRPSSNSRSEPEVRPRNGPPGRPGNRPGNRVGQQGRGRGNQR